MVDVGSPGRRSDGGTLTDSSIGKRLEKNLMDLPEPQKIDEDGPALPYYLVGDEAVLKNICNVHIQVELQEILKWVNKYLTTVLVEREEQLKTVSESWQQNGEFFDSLFKVV